jgi:histidyl-tRNA synthetase
MGTQKSSPADFLAKASATARHYGFDTLSRTIASNTTLEKKSKSSVNKLKQTDKNIDAMRGELVSGLEALLTNRSKVDEPILFYTSNADSTKQKKHSTFGIHVVGAKESFAEALLLRVGLSILEDTGHKNYSVRIGSIGNRDSSAKYIREAGNFFRRNMHALSPQLQTMLKEDIFLAAEHIMRKKHPLHLEMPKPVEYLSTHSRRHFQEVLEYLEKADLPYEMSDALLGHRDCYSETIFDIRPTDEQVQSPLIARGGRYDEFARRYLKSTVPAVGLTFIIDEPLQALPEQKNHTQKNPKAFFIHLGTEARLKSISVVERLRKARVPFVHSLSGGSFSDQLARAERESIPFAVIMGQREAISDAVIVRNIISRAQDTIPVEAIPYYFKEKLA